MKSFNLFECKLTEGFFANRQEINITTTLKAIYLRFKETGRFDAIKCKKTEIGSHIFWDSDVAKWLEASAYALSRREDSEIRAWYDEAINDLITNQREDGYFNSYFMVYKPEAIFTIRKDHELYCAGHLFEAAVACSKYLNDDRLLKFSDKYVDYIIDRFVIKKDTGFTTPGHPEIELALLRLYDYTKNDKYKILAKFFIDNRGVNNEPISFGGEHQQNLSIMPVRELKKADGHAVMANYLYNGITRLARIINDNQLKTVVREIFDDIYYKKMYVTGGVGSEPAGEKFSVAYDLPNYTAYAETCASISLALYAHQLFLIDCKAKYGDAIERATFNGILSGISLKGDSFFYMNPLEVHDEKIKFRDWLKDEQKHEWYLPYAPINERVKIFKTSCCPPNIARYIEQLNSLIFYEDDNLLIVNQYISANLETENYSVKLVSNFPYSGKISLNINSKGKEITLKLRVPTWTDKKFKNQEDGFLVYKGLFNNEEILIDFDAKLRLIYANPKVSENAGKVCVSYGPLILCAEKIDNEGYLQNYSINDLTNAKVEVNKDNPFVLKAYIPAKYKEESKNLYNYEKPKETIKILTLIPYFAWANRKKNDMRVWITKE